MISGPDSEVRLWNSSVESWKPSGEGIGVVLRGGNRRESNQSIW